MDDPETREAGTSRININAPQWRRDRMDAFAARRGTSLTAILLDGASFYEQLDRMISDGGTIILRYPDGTERELVLAGVGGP